MTTSPKPEDDSITVFDVILWLAVVSIVIGCLRHQVHG